MPMSARALNSPLLSRREFFLLMIQSWFLDTSEEDLPKYDELKQKRET